MSNSSNNIEKITADDVEIVNSAQNPSKPKITKIKADDNSSQSSQNSTNPFEEMFKKAQAEGVDQNNPLARIMGNIEEAKKIKIYFFISIVCGIIGLFTFREFFGTAAILLGIADMYFGSKLTKTPAQFGIFLGIVDLILYLQ